MDWLIDWLAGVGEAEANPDTEHGAAAEFRDKYAAPTGSGTGGPHQQYLTGHTALLPKPGREGEVCVCEQQSEREWVRESSSLPNRRVSWQRSENNERAHLWGTSQCVVILGGQIVSNNDKKLPCGESFQLVVSCYWYNFVLTLSRLC